MKTKRCKQCDVESYVMYRIQIEKGNNWIFVCKDCCEKSKKLLNYKYGGTWKGSRH